MLPVIQANINFPAGQPNIIQMLQQIQNQLAGLTAQVNVLTAQGIANTQAIAALGVNLRMEIRNSTLLAVHIGRSTTDQLLMLFNAQGDQPTAPLGHRPQQGGHRKFTGC
jgi:1-aminocyclopropane-1-carboxylate deaminase/D-cysteine desulfhydrase-like pyridoxal-dependent ACC family enzyme